MVERDARDGIQIRALVNFSKGVDLDNLKARLPFLATDDFPERFAAHFVILFTVQRSGRLLPVPVWPGVAHRLHVARRVFICAVTCFIGGQLARVPEKS